jgi:hypothetical protein
MTLSSPVDADQLRDSLLRFIEERVRLELLTAHNDTSLAHSATRLEISHRAPLWGSGGGGGGGSSSGEGQGQVGRQDGDSKKRGAAGVGVQRSVAPAPSPAASLNMSPARSSGAVPRPCPASSSPRASRRAVAIRRAEGPACLGALWSAAGCAR